MKRPMEVKGVGEPRSSMDELETSTSGWYWNESEKTLDVRHTEPRIEIILEAPKP